MRTPVQAVYLLTLRRFNSCGSPEIKERAGNMDQLIKPYDRLRGILRTYSITLDVLAKETRLKRSALSNRMRGVISWDMDTVYTICDLCDIPYTDIALYFERSKNK